MSKQFDIKSLFSGRLASISNLIEDGCGWCVGSTGFFPGQNPPRPTLLSIHGIGTDSISSCFRHAGLLIEVTYEVKSDDAAVRIEGKITNDDDKPVRAHRLRSLALRLNFSRETRLFVYSLNGANGTSFFPPKSFTLSKHELVGEPLGRGTYIDFDGGSTGLSSNKKAPYFVIQLDDLGGLFYALEWPATWFSCINRLEMHDQAWIELGPVAANAGFERRGLAGAFEEIDIMLNPGESLPLAGCVLGLYEGDQVEGFNALRRLVADMRPTLNGEKIACPVNYKPVFAVGMKADFPFMKAQADVCEKLGVEYIYYDMPWSKGAVSENNLISSDCWPGVGDWREGSPDKLPGDSDLSAYVHQKGMKFGLWIAPENCFIRSKFAAQHPDWVIPPQQGDHPGMVDWLGVVNFSKPEVVQWFKDTVDIIFPKFDVEWIMWDFNTYLEPCLSRLDPSDRRGITQIRFVEGVLDLWDYILSRHPYVLIEASAAGGNRMDLGCLKRAHTYWINDMTNRPYLQMYENTGANCFLPATYFSRSMNYTVPSRNSHFYDPETRRPYPPAWFHALMGGTVAIAEDLREWTDEAIADAAQHIQIFKDIRELLNHNYYAIFDQPKTLDEWVGWQFYKPETDEGVVFFFRCLSQTENVSPPLRWLKEDACYRFEDPYTKAISVYTGATLLSDGLPIELPQQGSCLLRYRLGE